MADRITGLCLLALAIFYGLEANSLKAGFGSGPIGPKSFPLVLAFTLGMLSVGMMFKVDKNPTWPPPRVWVDFALVLGSFVLYAYALMPLGFIAATILVTAFTSQRFGASWWQALVVGVGSSVALYALFVYALNLSLPTGTLWG